MNTDRNRNDGERDSYDDDMFSDAMAAYREVESGTDANTETPPLPAPKTGESSDDDADDQHEAEDLGSEGETDAERDARVAAARDDKGRFAPKKPGGDDKSRLNGAAAKDGQNAPAAPVGPPSSWGVKAKAAWETLPADVKAEIGKREGEMQQGLAALRDFKDLSGYAEQARRAGMTVKQGLDHYVALDNLLRTDIHGGMATLAQNLGYKTREQMGQLFAGLAEKYGGGGGGNPQPGQQNGGGNSEDDILRQILSPVLKPLMDEVAQLRQSSTSRIEADRNAQVQTFATEIQKFAADPANVYFANVESDIARLFAAGMVPNSGNPAADLKTAYDMAVRMHPEIQETLIERRAAEKLAAQRQTEESKAAKARNASRSLGGSRMPGVTLQREAQSAKSGYDDDLAEDVRKAYYSHAS